MDDRVERVARGICADDGLDPDMLRPDGKANWLPYSSNGRAAIAAHETALAAAGFVIVPREPTEAMKRAYWDLIPDNEDGPHPGVALRAMIDAAMARKGAG